MHIIKLGASSGAAAASLQDWGAVGLPLSEPACQLRGEKMVLPLEHSPEAGVWECTPGHYRRQIRSPELMHILSGEATFTPDGGEPVTLAAGEVLFFPADTLGVWHIQSTVRKLYLLFRPG